MQVEKKNILKDLIFHSHLEIILMNGLFHLIANYEQTIKKLEANSRADRIVIKAYEDRVDKLEADVRKWKDSFEKMQEIYQDVLSSWNFQYEDSEIKRLCEENKQLKSNDITKHMAIQRVKELEKELLDYKEGQIKAVVDRQVKQALSDLKAEVEKLKSPNRGNPKGWVKDVHFNRALDKVLELIEKKEGGGVR